MSTSTEVKTGGVGFMGLLAIVFITLKLLEVTAVATWSWWWVLAPLWLPAAIVMSFVILVVIFAAIANR